MTSCRAYGRTESLCTRTTKSPTAGRLVVTPFAVGGNRRAKRVRDAVTRTVTGEAFVTGDAIKSAALVQARSSESSISMRYREENADRSTYTRKCSDVPFVHPGPAVARSVSMLGPGAGLCARAMLGAPPTTNEAAMTAPVTRTSWITGIQSCAGPLKPLGARSCPLPNQQ